jgi:hypothetical protein
LSSRQTLLYKFVSCVPYYRSGNKIKNHTVRTVPKSNRKIVEMTEKAYNTTLSEQFLNLIGKS